MSNSDIQQPSAQNLTWNNLYCNSINSNSSFFNTIEAKQITADVQLNVGLNTWNAVSGNLTTAGDVKGQNVIATNNLSGVNVSTTNANFDNETITTLLTMSGLFRFFDGSNQINIQPTGLFPPGVSTVAIPSLTSNSNQFVVIDGTSTVVNSIPLILSSSALTLPFSGGIGSTGTISYYESLLLQNITVTGPWIADQTLVTSFQRIGNIVTMSWPNLFADASGGANAFIQGAAGSIPAQFVPIHSYTFILPVDDNGPKSGSLNIATDGSFSFQVSFVGQFGTSTSEGVLGGAVTFSYL